MQPIFEIPKLNGKIMNIAQVIDDLIKNLINLFIYEYYQEILCELFRWGLMV